MSASFVSILSALSAECISVAENSLEMACGFDDREFSLCPLKPEDGFFFEYVNADGLFLLVKNLAMAFFELFLYIVLGPLSNIEDELSLVNPLPYTKPGSDPRSVLL